MEGLSAWLVIVGLTGLHERHEMNEPQQGRPRPTAPQQKVKSGQSMVRIHRKPGAVVGAMRDRPWRRRVAWGGSLIEGCGLLGPDRVVGQCLGGAWFRNVKAVIFCFSDRERDARVVEARLEDAVLHEFADAGGRSDDVHARCYAQSGGGCLQAVQRLLSVAMRTDMHLRVRARSTKTNCGLLGLLGLTSGIALHLSAAAREPLIC